MSEQNSRPVSRISISLPAELLQAVDRMVAERGYDSRSHAINEVLHAAIAEHDRDAGDQVMVGTISLFYDHSVAGLQKRLADLQHANIDEVISSLHVNLIRNQTLEVVLVQGPARTLQRVADEMITLRGVISGKLHLVASVMPPVHPMNDRSTIA